MSNEARINTSLQVKVGGLEYRSLPTTFQADVSAARGPTPGLVLATVDGVDIDLSLLTNPGLAWFVNLDTTNYVTIGRYNSTAGQFYPLIELLATEGYALRLSRDLLQEWSGTSTVDTAATSTLRVKADTASCYVVCDVFEK